MTKETVTKAPAQKKATKPKATPEKVVVEKVEVKTKVKTPPEPTKVEPTPEPTPEPEAMADETELKEYKDCIASLTTLRNQTNEVVAKVKALNRRVEREMKAALKANNKKRQKSAARTPSGFTKPAQIVPELAKFLNVPNDTLVSRTDVTRAINTYILTNNLQDPSNRRRILCDPKLNALIKPGSVELTYFNMQRYLKPLFVASA